jgi:hypothetical protein
MKIFLILAILAGVGVLYGLIKASNRGISITPDTFPSEAALVVILSLVAWRFSRRPKA